MRRSSITIVTILIIVVTILIALLFAENAQYSTPIMTIDGSSYVSTDRGTEQYVSVEYMKVNASVKPAAIMPQSETPAMLPTTAAPHGDNTCTLTDERGMSFTVTTDRDCDTLQ